MRGLKSKLTRPSLLEGNTREGGGGDYLKTFGRLVVLREFLKKGVLALIGEIKEIHIKETFVLLILKNIKPGAYRGLGEINNYTDKAINHSKHFVDPEDDTFHTQHIERLNSQQANQWDIVTIFTMQIPSIVRLNGSYNVTNGCPIFV